LGPPKKFTPYYPEILRLLGEEILAVLGQEAWTKSALSKMQLLDSARKESKRLKPIQISKSLEGVSISTQQQITDICFPSAIMLRSTLEDYTLPDRTFVPKAHLVSVSTHAMRDPQVNTDATT
jgi:hypothetical protein